MAGQAVTTKEPLAPEITDEQLQKLIKEKKRVGAASCQVVTEGDQRFLVCEFPPLEYLTPEMFSAREMLEGQVDKLSADQAKALVAKIGTEFTEVKGVIDQLYPSSESKTDPNGDKAKKLLKILVSSTVKTSKDVETWKSAIARL